MTQSAEKSPFEEHIAHYLEAPTTYGDLRWSFLKGARQHAAAPEHLMAATALMLADLAGRTDDLDTLGSDIGIEQHANLSSALLHVAIMPDIVKIMPPGTSLRIADGLSVCLADRRLPDDDAYTIYPLVRSIISTNAQNDKPEDVAASLDKLAAATVNRDVLYIDVAKLAVSDNLNLAQNNGLAGVIDGFAGRIDPQTVDSSSNMHVRAMQVFAENKQDACDLNPRNAPALYQALVNFDDVIKATADDKAIAKRQGLLDGRKAIGTLVAHGQTKLF